MLLTKEKDHERDWKNYIHKSHVLAKSANRKYIIRGSLAGHTYRLTREPASFFDKKDNGELAHVR